MKGEGREGKGYSERKWGYLERRGGAQRGEGYSEMGRYVRICSKTAFFRQNLFSVRKLYITRVVIKITTVSLSEFLFFLLQNHFSPDSPFKILKACVTIK